MIKYSIIIPHYNIPSLLKRCIDSIPKRDDVEIIVVDDRSDIHCIDELRSIIHTRNDVRLIELTKNGGGGYARNQGLKEANGEWIVFADADDYFNYCFNDILDEYVYSTTDIVFFKVTALDCFTYENSQRSTLGINDYIADFIKSNGKHHENLRYLHGVPYSKIIRHQLIKDHNIRFDETRGADDTTFAYLIGYYATEIKADKRSLYCSTVREGSVSTLNDTETIFTILDVLGRAVVFFHSVGKQFYENFLAANLYLFLRSKDYSNFDSAIKKLVNLGLSENEIQEIFIREMGKYSLRSLIYCILYSPSSKLKAKGAKNMLTYAIPHHIKKILNTTIGKYK